VQHDTHLLDTSFVFLRFEPATRQPFGAVALTLIADAARTSVPIQATVLGMEIGKG
jgi:hypothetical protein